jgi:hypothetical protein
MIAVYRVKPGHVIKLHWEQDTKYFTVYTYVPASDWIHHYQCKDLLKAVRSMETWLGEYLVKEIKERVDANPR